jgi:hypothetical protein
MIPLGYADNLETRPRAAAKIIRKTEPARETDAGFLPTVAEVAARSAATTSPANTVGHVRPAPNPSDQPPPESDQTASDSTSDDGREGRGATSDHRSDPTESDADPASEGRPEEGSTDPTQLPTLHAAAQDADPPPSPEYSGELIGTCIRCRRGVRDQDPIFGAWEGKSWGFSGHTLPGAKRLAAFRPLLCSNCAVLAKYRLIPPPDHARLGGQLR